MSQERFPSSGVHRIRDVEVSCERWRIGGGGGSISGTRIMDLLLPPDEGMQETMLSHIEMTPSGTVDDVTDDDFAQIMPIGNR
jgi:hypothetical protein